jgi:imidazole glycerol-phosphate synthase subunit HisH
VIAIVDYGVGNLRSAAKALERAATELGFSIEVRVTGEPGAIDAAAAVVLPGVGAFGACMRNLEAAALTGPVRRAIASGKPFLGICVGMQMMYEGSDESPGVAGLGLLPGTVALLPEGVKRPQMQWNVLSVTVPECPVFGRLGSEPWVYFVHSYAAPMGAAVAATCDYGGDVVAAVGRERMWATQFHPEKSGATGLRLLANFAAVCA